MDKRDWLAGQFEENRPHLRSVAYRMLGSLAEADDAVQEAWLRLNRAGADDVENLGGWLTTVVSRVCLDMLRARKSRREDALEPGAPEPAAPRSSSDPEQETMLANSVGLALLVILNTLGPAERLAFVLHDMFGLSFDDIAPIVERSPEAARQLASRARRRVRGAETPLSADLAQQKNVVDAFLAAARAGDFEGLLAVLDPGIVMRLDTAAAPPGVPLELRDRALIAGQAIKGGARAAQAALVDGAVGVVIAPRGRLLMVIRFTVRDGRAVEMEAIANKDRLASMEIAALELQ